MTWRDDFEEYRRNYGGSSFPDPNEEMVHRLMLFAEALADTAVECAVSKQLQRRYVQDVDLEKLSKAVRRVAEDVVERLWSEAKARNG